MTSLCQQTEGYYKKKTLLYIDMVNLIKYFALVRTEFHVKPGKKIWRESIMKTWFGHL